MLKKWGLLGLFYLLFLMGESITMNERKKGLSKAVEV